MNPINVRYNGRLVGRLAEAALKGRTCIFFEYAPEFLASGIQLSPLHLPLRSGLISRDDPVPSPKLPGVFEDSIPDRWGQRIMLDWFRRKDIAANNATLLAQLCYVGGRGMGALSYEPEEGPQQTGAIDLGAIYAEAMAVDDSRKPLTEILHDIGSPPGGIQPKALIALPLQGDGPCLGGSRAIPAGYEAWLVKFTPGRADPGNIGADGRIEEAYARMARAAGIDIPPTRLLETGDSRTKRRHFAVKRFDRKGGERIHHHTLAGMTHMSGADLDYEMFLAVTRRVTRDEREVLRAFRRAAFNVLARNDDDHGRNHGFLLQNGEWKLGPAYDLTFRVLRERGMAVCGERRNASVKDLDLLARRAALDRSETQAILGQVRATISCWPDYASAAKVPPRHAAEVAAALGQ